MQKKVGLVSIFLVFIVVVAIGHSIFQETQGGFLSGFAVRDADGAISPSALILFGEWILILMGIIFVYARHKIELKKEFHDLGVLKSRKNFKAGTELDNFYELLQDIRSFRLAAAAKVFGVDEDVIEEWAKALESEKLATLTYPRIGGPQIILRESVLTNPNEKEKAKEVKNG